MNNEISVKVNLRGNQLDAKVVTYGSINGKNEISYRISLSRLNTIEM